ncbi:MAG: cyclase family protein [Dehalococcoidia bacterium]
MDWSTVQELSERYRNWGRWGPEDELGTLNYATPEKLVEAARLVKRGRSFSLAIPFDEHGPQRLSSVSGSKRFNPVHTMFWDGADIAVGAQDFRPHIRSTDDMICMPLQCATQWDSLAHVLYGDQMYNNRPASLVTSQGAQKNGIDKAKDLIAGRGVLLDVARSKGVQWLEPGYAITSEDLEACIRSQGVEVGAGDFLLVRTGHMTLCRHQGGWGDYAGGDAPGLSLTTAGWLYQREVAALCTDTWGVEVRPNETPDVMQPLHVVTIPNMGLLLGEIFYLDDLAEDCAHDGIYEFLFVAPPLPITGAVGSPVNPQAIK